jgi:hypothetical protein
MMWSVGQGRDALDDAVVDNGVIVLVDDKKWMRGWGDSV